jgi:hypothetical protein
LGTPREETVPALKLVSRRKFLGYFIFMVNLPLLLWNGYNFASDISMGTPWNSPDALSGIFLIVLCIGVTIILPFWSPVFTSSYWFTTNGIKISRFLKGSITVPYTSIARAEIYARSQREGKPSREAMQYAKESASELRRSGFKFADYTNDDASIVLLISEKNIYLLSPTYPKAFTQKLRKRVRKLSIKMVELTPKGKRIRQI